jgi:hypothetical protein
MKADMAAMQEKSASSSDRDAGDRLEGPHDLDRPPRFQKLDFPRYDGKTDPLLFINKCESSFSPTAHLDGGARVDGLVQLGGRLATLVHPTLGG